MTRRDTTLCCTTAYAIYAYIAYFSANYTMLRPRYAALQHVVMPHRSILPGANGAQRRGRFHCRRPAGGDPVEADWGRKFPHPCAKHGMSYSLNDFFGKIFNKFLLLIAGGVSKGLPPSL